jgi:hypothetical protein
MSTGAFILHNLAPGMTSRETTTLERSDDLADERFRRDCLKADNAPGSDEFSDDEFLSCDSNGGA